MSQKDLADLVLKEDNTPINNIPSDSTPIKDKQDISLDDQTPTKDKTKEDTNITYTLPEGYTLGDNNMGYKEIVRVETIDPIKHVNPETGEVTYTAPAGYTLKGNCAYRYVTYMEFIPPTVTKIH